MGIWQRITSTVKRWLGGGSSSTKKTPPRPRIQYSNRDARRQIISSRTSGRGRVLVDVDDEKEEKRVADAFKAKSAQTQDITSSFKKAKDDIATAFKKEATPDPKVAAAKKSRAEMRKKLDAKKQEHKEWHEVTNNRFNVGEKGISDEERQRRRQNVKMQTYDSKTAVKEAEHQMKWHGKEMSFARGALSGATFGASDLAAKKLTKGEAKKAEEVYQKNKSKGWETAGEIVGSLASFGATAGATDALGEKVIEKAAPRAAEKLAGTKLIQNAAKKSVTKAVEKGSVKGATKELIEQVGKKKAEKIVRAFGTDIAQNLTTGAIYDINKATAEYEWGSPEWWTELGKSAAFNAAITGVVGVGSAFTGNKNLVKDAADYLINDPTRRSAAARARGAVFGKAAQAEYNLDRTPLLNQENVRIANMARRNDAERWLRNETKDSLLANAEKAAANIDESGRVDIRQLSNAREGLADSAETVAGNRAAKEARLDEIDAEIERYRNTISLMSDDPRIAYRERKQALDAIDSLIEERKALINDLDDAMMARVKQDPRYANYARYEDLERQFDELTDAVNINNPDPALVQQIDEITAEMEQIRRANGGDYFDTTRERIRDEIAFDLNNQDIASSRADYEAALRGQTTPPEVKTEVKAEAPKVEPEAKPKTKKLTKDEALREELQAEKAALQEQYEAAKAAGEPATEILDDMQEIDLMLKDVDRKIANANKGKAVPPEAKTETRTTPPKARTIKDEVEELTGRPLDELRADVKGIKRVEESQIKSTAGKEPTVKARATQKATPPSTKPQAEANAKPEVEDGFEPKMRGRYDHLNEGLKKETEGSVGLRGGIKIAEERASDAERKRIIKEAGAEINQVIKDAHENAIHGGDFTYKVLTQGQRDDMFFDSYNKVRSAENVSQVVEELEDKMDKILRESEANPWGMTDQITLKDLSDMLAVEQVYRDAGKELPPEYEEIMTRLINLQGTQYGQGNRGRYLILKERSPRFRETLLTKDTAKYIDNVFGEDRLKDISRSLDANHGEKNYLENELKRIADYENTFADLPAEERQAAADRAYKELQKDILRNAKMTVWDAINLYRHTGMLSALATGGRNILGNVSQFLMRELSDKATYFAERGLAKAGGLSDDFVPTTVLTYKGKDSKKLANHLTSGAVGKLTKTDDAYFDKFADKEYARKITDVVNDAVADMMNIEKYETNAQKGADYVAETVGEKAVKGFAWLPRKATKAVNFMLNEPDSWFVETRFRKGLMRYLEANGITDSATLAGKENILKDAIEHAKGQALEDTYKKANRVTSFLEKIRSSGLKHDDNVWRNLAKKGAMITLDAELPYLKVPVNVGINTVKYSPINIVKSLVDANTAIKRGDAKALSKAAEELSKGLTGTGLAALGFLLNCDEQDSDDSSGFIAKAQDALKEYGIKDYSLKVGDHVYDISNIGQGATQLLMGARAAEVINENGGAPKGFLDKLDLVRECFAAPVDSIAEMGILDNALGVIDAFSNEGDYEKGFAERVGDAATGIGWDYAGQFIPQPLRGVARGITSSDLDMGVRKGEGVTATQKRLQSNVNKFVGAIPYANEKVLPHKVDSHGNYVNERKTNQDKLKAVLNNTVNPVRATKVHIPEADKVELRVKDDKGNSYVPKKFDQDRTYKATIGKGSNKEEIELTGKERERAAHSVKQSGKDMAHALVYSKAGFLGDSHSERAQQILRECPEDEEKAREYLYSLPEFTNLKTDEERRKYMDALYYGGGQSGGQKNYGGRERTSNRAVYVDIKGHTEDEFRFANDLSKTEQENYAKHDLESRGVSKGDYADAIEAVHYAEHEYKNGQNIDTINGKKNIVAGIKTLGLSPEENIAIYEALRGNRKWKDWDGVSDVSSGYGRRRRRRGYRHYGHGGGGRSAKVPAIKESDFKATKRTYKDTAAMLKSNSRNKGLSKTATVKVEPPKVKFKKYEV